MTFGASTQDHNFSLKVPSMILNFVTHPQTCSQSLHNSEDEGFRKAFLPNIRLFLRKDSINMSEWNRLSHFNNPFGFMEYKYEGRCFLTWCSQRQFSVTSIHVVFFWVV